MMAISSSKKHAVYIVVTILGGLASIFGIVGSFRGVKNGNGTFKFAPDNSYCTWQTSPAAGFGIAGCVLMLVAQITSNVNGGCVCCCAKQSSPLGATWKTCAILCLILSWMLTIAGSGLLLYGGIMNSAMGKMSVDVTYAYPYRGSRISAQCSDPQTWPLFLGGVACMIATALSFLFFHIVAQHSSSPNTIITPQTLQMMPPVIKANTKNKNAPFEFAPPARPPVVINVPRPAAAGSYHAPIHVAPRSQAGARF